MGRKEAYEERLDAELWEWESKIERLKAKADKSANGAGVKYQKQIEKLQSKHREVEKRLEELMVAGDGELDELKSHIEEAWKDLKRAMESASSKIQ